MRLAVQFVVGIVLLDIALYGQCYGTVLREAEAKGAPIVSKGKDRLCVGSLLIELQTLFHTIEDLTGGHCLCQIGMGALLGDAIALIVGGDEDASRNEILILVDSQGIGSPDKARQERYIISRPRGSRTLLVGSDGVVVVDVYRLNGIRCLWLCRSPCYQQGRQHDGFSRYAH